MAVIVWLLDLQLPKQSVPITTEVVSLNFAHAEVYSIQQYVIKFVIDLRQVGGFFRFLPQIKSTATIQNNNFRSFYHRRLAKLCYYILLMRKVCVRTNKMNYTLVLLLSIGIQILEIPICQKNSHVS